MKKSLISFKNYLITFLVSAWILTILLRSSYAHWKDSIGGLNLHVVQAKAFLEGRLDFVCTLSDNAYFRGKCFSPYPPLPALFYVPLVWIVNGEINRINPMTVGILLTIASMYLVGCLAKRFFLSLEQFLWWLTAFFLGTGYFFAFKYSTGVWTTAHVFSVFFLWLSIYAASKGSAIGAATGLACSFLCRQMTIFNYFFIGILLWENLPNRRGRSLFFFHLIIAVGVIVYLIFNYLRFESIWETGYRFVPPSTSFFHKMALEKGNFDWIYFGYNFYYMFFHGFQIFFHTEEYWHSYQLDWNGTSLLAASPFVVIALWANQNVKLIMAAWLSIVAVLIPLLCFANNGWMQINTQRFSLDFLPTLFCLIAWGMQNTEIKWVRLLVGYSVGLNILALWIL
ncbi:MAG: hypothetical protein NZM38_11315 [Cytophagales bacterium]|nr:hypothetical protein [Cytophagales bacterium]MDW8385345.1 hypothetical protein [Flammeovirgaceae bacterium]